LNFYIKKNILDYTLKAITSNLPDDCGVTPENDTRNDAKNDTRNDAKILLF
jgi:hypothetical protein